MLKFTATMVRMIQKDRQMIEEQIEKEITKAFKEDDSSVIMHFGNKVSLAIEIAESAGFYVEVDSENQTLRISW